MKDYAISSGSVIGFDHVYRFKPNQDFHFLEVRDDWAYGMVSDGCGSRPYTQFGSILLCKLVKQYLDLVDFPALEREGIPKLLSDMKNDVLLRYRILLPTLGMEDPQEAAQYLLATMMGFILVKDFVVVFYYGDGYYHFSGSTIQDCTIKAPNNAPPYLVYSLFPEQLPEYVEPAIGFALFSTEDFKSLLISTDGIEELKVSGLNELLTGPIFLKNPAAVQRFLQKQSTPELKIDYDEKTIVKTPVTFKDDTTMILIRRR